MVPRAAYAWVTQKMKQNVSLPLVATNRYQPTITVISMVQCLSLCRINTPSVANEIVAKGCADMVSMARYISIP